ncbi:MAG: hypothetical protein AB7H80_06930 [Candidatus Kapaibacterium sp.]
MENIYQNRWKLILPAALLLLPIIAWPAGPDQSIYLTAGRILADGGVYYRDVADVKPPFISFLFAAANGLFGEGILPIRLIEYGLQLLILSLITRSLQIVGEARRTIVLATILYALLYASLGPDGTPQPESFVGLLLLPMMVAQIRWRNRSGAILVGLLCGLLFTLKFSFGAVILSAVAAEFLIFREPNRKNVSYSLWILFAAGTVVLLFFLTLLLFNTISGWEMMSGWIRGRLLYSIQSENPLSLILRQTGFYLGYGFTLTMLLATFAAVVRTLKGVKQPEKSVPPSESIARWGQLSVLTFITLFGSALVELMFVPYQFSRIFVPAALLVAPVLVGLWERRAEFTEGIYAKGVLAILIGIGFLFSPLPKYVSESWRGISWRLSVGLTSGESFDLSADQRWGEVKRLCDTIRAHSTGSVEVYAVSDIAAFFYSELRTSPTFGILHGHYLIATFTPKELQQEFVDYLRKGKPEFLILERNDAGAASIVGSASTLQALEKIEGFNNLLNSKYVEVCVTDSFVLYVRGVYE